MTITKFKHDSDASSDLDNVKKKRVLHIKRKNPSLDHSKVIYSFETFESFCDFCNFLSSGPHKSVLPSIAKNSALYEYSSNYYLIFTNINLKSNITNSICQSITEFAHYIDNAELFEKRIIEYGKPIIKSDALTTCIEYFCLK